MKSRVVILETPVCPQKPNTIQSKLQLGQLEKLVVKAAGGDSYILNQTIKNRRVDKFLTKKEHFEKPY